MKTKITCPECKEEISTFQASYENVDITYDNAYLHPRSGLVDYDTSEYSVSIPGASGMVYRCSNCFEDITRIVTITNDDNWRERRGIS